MNLTSTKRVTLDQLRRLGAAFAQARAAASTQRDSSRPDGQGIPDPVLWAEQVADQVLDPWQRALLYSKALRLLLNCSRQVGKTEVVSLRASYRARFLRKKVLVLAPSLYQSSKVRVRAERFLTAGGAVFTTKNATTLELDNGGAVIALPGDRPDLTARGETADDLIVDEASRVRRELITAVTPTIATRPDAILTYLSTPAGKQGEFYRAWIEENDWLHVEVPATECPRISKTFLERMRRQLGNTLFAQEFECKFIASSSSILDPDAIEAMFSQPPPAPLFEIDWTKPVTKTLQWPR